MDRQGEGDRQALVHIVVTLLSLAAIASAAGAQSPRNHLALFAVLRHAASVACALTIRLHAPLDRRLWQAPASCEPAEPIDLAEIFRALAVALAFPARAAMRAARWLAHRTVGLPGECPAGSGFVSRPAERPRYADTS